MKLLPCPFCGSANTFGYETNQGTKYGYIICGYCNACGPEVKTKYDVSENAEWHKDAGNEWNKRVN